MNWGNSLNDKKICEICNVMFDNKPKLISHIGTLGEISRPFLKSLFKEVFFSDLYQHSKIQKNRGISC